MTFDTFVKIFDVFIFFLFLLPIENKMGDELLYGVSTLGYKATNIIKGGGGESFLFSFLKKNKKTIVQFACIPTQISKSPQNPFLYVVVFL